MNDKGRYHSLKSTAKERSCGNRSLALTGAALLLAVLTLGFLGLRNQGIHLAVMYWGLWLLPLGILVYKSDFLPRLLGVLVFIRVFVRD